MMKETWYVSCSPRNPLKLAPELALLATLEGEKWNATDKKHRKLTQLKFAEVLSKSPEFEGKISTDRAFSARDRVAPLKTFGFCYIDKKDRLRITQAGKRLISGKRIKELFLKQLLKWQYPSYQHHGAEYVQKPDFFVKDTGFWTLPFVDCLRVLRAAEGLTKREIAMFLLPRRRMVGTRSIVKAILAYRKGREAKRGRVPRKRFAVGVHGRLYRKLYYDRLRSLEKKGRTKQQLAAELLKKIRNSMDIADAAIRLFRQTGLLTVQSDRLIIAPERVSDVDAILGMDLKPVKFYENVETFYKYVGDPDSPKLPWETSPKLAKRVRAAAAAVERVHQELGERVRVDVPSNRKLASMTLEKLKDIIDGLESRHIKASERLLAAKLRTPEAFREIQDMFGKIELGDVIDPSVYFEWNLWRAIAAIDQAKDVRPNFEMDADLMPVNHAPGNRADVEADYGDFAILVEGTLSAGRRQYFTEAEPVTAHVGEFAIKERARTNGRKVYGVFVAPVINPGAAEYFFVHIRHHKYPGLHDHAVIIPLSLEQFGKVLALAAEKGPLTPNLLESLLKGIHDLAASVDDTPKWLAGIPQVLADWSVSIGTN